MLYFLLYLQQIYYKPHHCDKRGDVVRQCKKPNKMRTLSIISILYFCLSCNNNNTKEVEKLDNSKEVEKPISENKIKSDSTDFKNYQNEVMNEEDILFNGRLKRYFTLKEFENVFGKADSIKLMSEEEEEPCSYIFEFSKSF